MTLILWRLFNMAEKIYVIDDKVEVKERYLKMTKEERQKEIQNIISEDRIKRNQRMQALKK